MAPAWQFVDGRDFKGYQQLIFQHGRTAIAVKPLADKAIIMGKCWTATLRGSDGISQFGHSVFSGLVGLSHGLFSIGQGLLEGNFTKEGSRGQAGRLSKTGWVRERVDRLVLSYGQGLFKSAKHRTGDRLPMDGGSDRKQSQ